MELRIFKKLKRTLQNSKNRKILIQSTLKIPSKKQKIGIIQTSLNSKSLLAGALLLLF